MVTPKPGDDVIFLSPVSPYLSYRYLHGPVKCTSKSRTRTLKSLLKHPAGCLLKRQEKATRSQVWGRVADSNARQTWEVISGFSPIRMLCGSAHLYVPSRPSVHSSPWLGRMKSWGRTSRDLLPSQQGRRRREPAPFVPPSPRRCAHLCWALITPSTLP